MTAPECGRMSLVDLSDYAAGDLPEAEAAAVEEHLFACSECAGRLERLTSVAGAIVALARRGRISGIISRPLLNRLQRDGVNVRVFSLTPGETVPCAAFPGDDLVVAALRADFSGISAVKLSVSQAAQGSIAGNHRYPGACTGPRGLVGHAWFASA